MDLEGMLVEVLKKPWVKLKNVQNESENLKIKKKPKIYLKIPVNSKN